MRALPWPRGDTSAEAARPSLQPTNGEAVSAMQRYRSTIGGVALGAAVGFATLGLAAWGLAARAEAGGSLELCQAVARHLWSVVATRTPDEQTPLAALTAAVPSAVKAEAGAGFARPGQSVADALAQDHGAPDALVGK